METHRTSWRGPCLALGRGTSAAGRSAPALKRLRTAGSTQGAAWVKGIRSAKWAGWSTGHLAPSALCVSSAAAHRRSKGGPSARAAAESGRPRGRGLWPPKAPWVAEAPNDQLGALNAGRGGSFHGARLVATPVPGRARSLDLVACARACGAGRRASRVRGPARSPLAQGIACYCGPASMPDGPGGQTAPVAPDADDALQLGRHPLPDAVDEALGDDDGDAVVRLRATSSAALRMDAGWTEQLGHRLPHGNATHAIRASPPGWATKCDTVL